MKRFVTLMAIFVLPAWMFDSFANRDPTFYLDDKSKLIAPWCTAPLAFDYRDRANRDSPRYQLQDITDFKLNDAVFTGKTGEQFFIVQRPGGEKAIFPTEAERDAALIQGFATTASDLREKPWYSGIRANIFFPYNMFYYFGVTGLIVIVCIYRGRDRITPNRVPATD